MHCGNEKGKIYNNDNDDDNNNKNLTPRREVSQPPNAYTMDTFTK